MKIKRIKFNYYPNQKISGILLASFNMNKNDIVTTNGMFGRKKNVIIETNRKYCLVFIPWKHRAKQIDIIEMDQVISLDELEGEDIICVEKFISRFEFDDPYFNKYVISNFVGYKFIYDNKNIIGNILHVYFDEALTELYDNYPELLQEEFDEEQ